MCQKYRMARRTINNNNGAPVAFEVPIDFGENGLVKLEYIGKEPDQFKGPFTGMIYPFDERSILFVDVRDAFEMDDVEEFQPWLS